MFRARLEFSLCIIILLQKKIKIKFQFKTIHLSFSVIIHNNTLEFYHNYYEGMILFVDLNKKS